MDNNDKNKIQTGKNDVAFPLIFGIAAVIIMAVISHFMGN